jgi:uncharacterized protein (DUF2141 family)
MPAGASLLIKPEIQRVEAARYYNTNNLIVMKPFSLFLLAFLSFTALPSTVATVCAAEQEQVAVPAGTGAITVRISGLRNTNGNLSVALFNTKEGFPGKFDRAFMKTVVPASGSEHVVVFDTVPFGSYAVAVRHDENANGKLDANFLGMPKEGVGTSNNPRSRFGPPSFKDASFLFDQSSIELNVNLRYL